MRYQLIIIFNIALTLKLSSARCYSFCACTTAPRNRYEIDPNLTGLVARDCSNGWDYTVGLENWFADVWSTPQGMPGQYLENKLDTCIDGDLFWEYCKQYDTGRYPPDTACFTCERPITVNPDGSLQCF